jgi:hypothetical protein
VVVCGLSVPAMASADYSSAVLADSPLAFYHLNEASGLVAADSSGNGPATDGLYAVGGVSYGVAGPFPGTGSASAVSLTSGTVDSVVLASARTASLWVKPSGRVPQTFLKHGDPAGDGWAIGIAPNNAPRGGKRKLFFQSHGVSVNSKLSLASGVWSMVSVSWGAASVSFHLNGGANSKTVNTPASWVVPGPAANPALKLGPGVGAGGTSFAEVAIFAAVLTKAQLTAHYTATLLPTVLSPPVLSPLSGVREGDTLTLTPAIYSALPTSTSFEWQRCDTDGACAPIAGAAGTTYLLAAADIDHSIQVQEGATNANGSIGVISDATDFVLGALPPPVTPPTGPPCLGAARLAPTRRRSVRLGTVRATLTLNARKRRATLRARGGKIRSVAFRWDNRRVRPPRTKPRTLTIRKAWLKPGKHTLKATIRPRHGKRRTIKMRVTVTRC